MTTDPQTAEPGLCPNCQHPEHGIGIECEHRVEHDGQRHWHVCLCLNRPGASRPCSPLMTCQGGTLGYADVWYLQRGQRLQSADGGVVKPDVLLAAEEAASAPPSPADRSGLRERIAEALHATRRTGYEGAANHRQHRYDARCALCAGDVDALTEALLSVLPPAADRAAEIEQLQAEVYNLRTAWKSLVHCTNEDAAALAEVSRSVGVVPDEHRTVSIRTIITAIQTELRRVAGEATPVAASRSARAEALLLHFTAEAHRRKWAYDRGLDDDGVPLKSEAFDALHRLGDEMNTALHKLRCGGGEERQAETHARECPPGVHSMFDFCPGDCGEPVADDPACTCASAGEAFVPSGHYADCPCPEARQQHGPAAAPVAGQPPADTGEAQPRFVRVCIACPECDHTLDENSACANGCHDKGPRP